MIRVRILAAAAVVALVLASASLANPTQSGKPVAVGATGCDFTTIQAAINAVPDGSTIQVTAGSYKETLTIQNRHGLTLQGAGTDKATLDGNGPQQKDLTPAILIKGSSNVTVRGLRITNGRRGVNAIDSTGLIVDSCLFDANLRLGIRLENTDAEIKGSTFRSGRPDLDGSLGGGIGLFTGSKAALESDTITSNLCYGVDLEGASQAVITDSEITDTSLDSKGDYGIGVSVFSSSVLTLRSCTVSGNSNCGIQIHDTAQVSIVDCTCSGNFVEGMLIDGSAHVDIVNCQVSGTKVSPPPSSCCGSGIVGRGQSQVSIQNCTMSDNAEAGVWIDDSGQVSVSSSTITGNQQDGIQVRGTAVATISGCTVSANTGDGLWVRDSSHATITSCSIEDTRSPSGYSSAALFASGSSQVTITGSTVSGNRDYGVLLIESTHVTLTTNTITNNSGGTNAAPSVSIADDMYGRSQTVTAELSANKITGNKQCGVCVGESPGTTVTGSGNTITGNSEAQLCGTTSKFPKGFGGGK